MTILGIDPGSVVTGIGVIAQQGRRIRLVHAGFLRAQVKEPFQERLLYLHKALDQLLQDHEVDEVSVETPFYGVNVKSLMQMCHARGSLLAAVARHGIPVHEYAPREIKKAVVGNGNASKEQVVFMVKQALKDAVFEEDWPLDVTDAIATALCRAHRLGNRVVGVDDGSTVSFADRLIAAGATTEAARRAQRGGR